MSEETKRRLEGVRRELRREYDYSQVKVDPELLKVKLNRFNSIVHPRPEVTGW